MNDFQFYSPTEFIFGRNTEAQAGAAVRKHGGTRVLLHSVCGQVGICLWMP